MTSTAKLNSLKASVHPLSVLRMATADSGGANRFVKVSSLYGPGTIAAWYFTVLSVLVSWTLHPRKRKSGSIDVDLVATLTLPAVAVGHLMW